MQNKEGAEAPTNYMQAKDKELIINQFNKSGKIWQILPTKYDCENTTNDCISCTDGQSSITLCSECDLVMVILESGESQGYTPFEFLIEILDTDPIFWLINEGWLTTTNIAESVIFQQAVKVSYFSSPISNIYPSKEITIREIYDIIRGNKLKSVTSALREIKKLDEKKYKVEKAKRLPYVTYGGTFKERADNQLKNASGNMCFDIDHINNIEATKKALLEDTNLGIVILSTSPGGDGVKLILRSPDAASYKEAYQDVRDYLKRQHNITTDSTQDISRACFLCHDPDAYYNEFAPPTRLPITTLPIPLEPLSRSDSNKESKKISGVIQDILAAPLAPVENVNHLNEPDLNVSMLFQQQIEFTNNKLQYVEGKRNKYIHLLASNCNRAGILQESTSELSFLFFDLDEEEIRATVRSVYKNQSHEFGKFAKLQTTILYQRQENEPKVSNVIVQADGSSKLIGLFKAQPANEWIEEASRRPIPQMLFSEFWHEGEICILFASSNLGKSLLAVQISNSISKGIAIVGFKLETQKQVVLYFDFELSDKQFENRYSEGYTYHYHFDDNLIRVEINPEAELPEKIPFEDYLTLSIERLIMEKGVKILIIDNLTYLRTETEKAKDALPLMKLLKALKTKYGLSLLILAHTPKRDLFKPLSKNDLQGSSMLMNFCDSSFAIGESNTDSKLRYLKQIKARNTEIMYDSENVCVCQITKSNSFLQFEFIGFGSEARHLKQMTDKEKSTADKVILDMASKGKSLREIGKELNISHTTVKRKLEKHGKTIAEN